MSNASDTDSMSDSDNSGKDVDFSDFKNIDESNNLMTCQFEPTISANKERNFG